MGIVDHGVVRAEHARTLLHFAPDAGTNKAESLAAKLAFLNPEVQVDPYPVALDGLNARPIADGFDVVLDCSGDPATARALNVASGSLRIPIVRATARPDACEVALARPGVGACLECAPSAGAAPPAEHAGGPVAGIAGALAAREAIRCLTGAAAPARIFTLELDGARASETAIDRRPDCEACAGIERRLAASRR
jgi:adenylyltransferase/sulfurtransferase